MRVGPFVRWVVWAIALASIVSAGACNRSTEHTSEGENTEIKGAGARDTIGVTPVEGRPGFHDHTPHHGGVVVMSGMIHLEALAEPQGQVKLYVTDVWRRPLPLETVRGSVTLTLPDRKQIFPLAAAGDAMVANGPALRQPRISARFELTVDDRHIDESFTLPLAIGEVAAGAVPVDGCVPAPSEAGTGRVPRCTLSFPRAITALSSTPDGSLMVVTGVDLGVTGWRLPEATLAVGFAAPPPITLPVAEPPHPEAPNAVALSPDGSQAVVALESRLLRYSVGNGWLVRELPPLGRIIRDVAWSPDGATLLVTTFYDSTAHLLSAQDGQARGLFALMGEGAAVAFAPHGDLAAVASDSGPIAVFDTATSARRFLLTGARGATRALVFAGDRLVSAGDDALVRFWDVGTGALMGAIRLPQMLTRLAVAPGGQIVASAGLDGIVRLHDRDRMNTVESLEFHRAQVLGLTWAGSVLASGDLSGRVALWEGLSHAVAPGGR